MVHKKAKQFIIFLFRFCLYSVRKASTGSFLAATRDGRMPAKTVSTIEIAMRTIADQIGREEI